MSRAPSPHHVGGVFQPGKEPPSQVFDLVLVTRNVKHVAWTGVSQLNPFDSVRP